MMEETHKSMLDKVVKWGDSIEAAVKLALNDLKLSEDEVDVEVLEQPTKGFLGFHKKLAKVCVTRKPEPEKTPVAEPKTVIGKPSDEPVRETFATTEEPVQGTAEAVEEPEKPQGSFFSEKNAYVIADPLNNAEDGDFSGDYAEGEEEEILKPVRRRRPDRRRGAPVSLHTKFTVTEDDTDAVPADDSYGAEFVRKIISQMGLESVEVHASLLDDVLYISLTGNEVGALIGKRGRTLDSLQYLASIVQNKNTEKYTRVLINAESYREKREKTLQQFARKVADKCARSGRNQRLEPMNPYERKVIHSTLQSDPRVTTRSEGSEPSRRVVIEVRK